MTPKCSCEKCKFADKKELKSWKSGKEIPYYFYPGKRDFDENNDCQSGREK